MIRRVKSEEFKCFYFKSMRFFAFHSLLLLGGVRLKFNVKCFMLSVSHILRKKTIVLTP